jgi:uncharacterized protein
MSVVMMALGPYRFSLDTAAYESLERTAAWRWESNDRIGRAPALQYAGKASQTIRLSGAVFPAWRGGIGQLDEMRALGDKGEPLMLTDGLGFVWGRWVITEVTESQSAFLAMGAPRKQAWTLALTYYGEDVVPAVPPPPPAFGEWTTT